MDNQVLQGLAQFQASVEKLAQTRAIRDARDQIEMIHQSDLKEEEKVRAFKNLGQQFAFSAAASGMPLGQAEQLIGQIVPKERFYQTPAQAMLNAPEGSAEALRGKQIFEAENAQEIKKIRTTAEVQAEANAVADERRTRRELKAAQAKELRYVSGDIDNFVRSADVKPLMEARTDIANINAVADDKLANTSVGFNLMKKGLARLAEGGGKITDKDYEIIQGDPDYVSRVRRYLDTAVAGKPLKEDVQIVRDAARVLARATESRLAEAANNYAAAKEPLYQYQEPGTLLNQLNARLGFGVRQVAPAGRQPAPIPGAPSAGAQGTAASGRFGSRVIYK